MSISMLSKIVFLAALLLAPLNAEETKEHQTCDDYYNICTDRCEQVNNPSENCFNICEEEYDKCLSLTTENTKTTSE